MGDLFDFRKDASLGLEKAFETFEGSLFWDKTALEKLIRETDETVAKEIFHDFLNSLQEAMTKCTPLLERQDFIALYAHRLRVSSGNLGFFQFHRLCVTIDDYHKSHDSLLRLQPLLKDWQRVGREICAQCGASV